MPIQYSLLGYELLDIPIKLPLIVKRHLLEYILLVCGTILQEGEVPLWYFLEEFEPIEQLLQVGVGSLFLFVTHLLKRIYVGYTQ